jgi:hypothetical protein
MTSPSICLLVRFRSRGGYRVQGENRYPVLILPKNKPFSLQISQMCNRFAGGKPLLCPREALPGITVKVPGHSRRHLESGQLSVCKDRKDFLKPCFMVLLQLGDSSLVICDEPPVARKDQVDFHFIHFVQACQVVLKGILIVCPALDIGCDVNQNIFPTGILIRDLTGNIELS